MDRQLRELERRAATSDREARDALRRARTRSGRKPWTEKQVEAAKWVWASRGHPLSFCRDTGRRLRGEYWDSDILWDPGITQRVGNPFFPTHRLGDWFPNHCYPRLIAWAERVLIETGNLIETNLKCISA